MKTGFVWRIMAFLLSLYTPRTRDRFVIFRLEFREPVCGKDIFFV